VECMVREPGSPRRRDKGPKQKTTYESLSTKSYIRGESTHCV